MKPGYDTLELGEIYSREKIVTRPMHLSGTWEKQKEQYGKRIQLYQ